MGHGSCVQVPSVRKRTLTATINGGVTDGLGFPAKLESLWGDLVVVPILVRCFLITYFRGVKMTEAILNNATSANTVYDDQEWCTSTAHALHVPSTFARSDPGTSVRRIADCWPSGVRISNFIKKAEDVGDICSCVHGHDCRSTPEKLGRGETTGLRTE